MKNKISVLFCVLLFTTRIRAPHSLSSEEKLLMELLFAVVPFPAGVAFLTEAPGAGWSAKGMDLATTGAPMTSDVPKEFETSSFKNGDFIFSWMWNEFDRTPARTAGRRRMNARPGFFEMYSANLACFGRICRASRLKLAHPGAAT